MALVEQLIIWGPLVWGSMAFVYMKGWWKLTSLAGLFIWLLGWVFIYYMDIFGLLATLFYLGLFTGSAVVHRRLTT